MKQILFIVLAFVAGIPLFAQADSLVANHPTKAMLHEDYDVEFTDNNRVAILPSATEKFNDLFLAIRAARHTIHLEYFNFRNDSISKALFSLLHEKAKEGVRVRAIFDGYGNSSNDRPLRRRHIRSIREAGVELYYFDPMRFPWVNHASHRDHRKLVVIDGMIAYIGGINVADYYLKGKPEFGEWRDLHVRVEGDAVGHLQKVFVDFWNKVAKQKLSCDSLIAHNCDARIFFPMLKPDSSATAGRKRIGVVNRIPRVSSKIIRKTYCSLLDNARHSVQIINPYFTLNRKTLRAFKRALARGINVEVMVSEKSDIKISPKLVEHTAAMLMKRGAKIYFYQNGFHHTKMMLIDDSLAFLGSANFNSRSMSYDYECNILIEDASTVEELRHIFEVDKSTHCYLLTPEIRAEMRKWRKMKGWLYQIFRPFVYLEKDKRQQTR